METVLQLYSKQKGEKHAGSLAVKLARQAIFGEDIHVLKRCTPFGQGHLLGLPVEEL